MNTHPKYGGIREQFLSKWTHPNKQKPSVLRVYQVRNPREVFSSYQAYLWSLGGGGGAASAAASYGGASYGGSGGGGGSCCGVFLRFERLFHETFGSLLRFRRQEPAFRSRKNRILVVARVVVEDVGEREEPFAGLEEPRTAGRVLHGHLAGQSGHLARAVDDGVFFQLHHEAVGVGVGDVPLLEQLRHFGRKRLHRVFRLEDELEVPVRPVPHSLEGQEHRK
mmetsp:Transcript_5972/g.10038  ORF Transcript_5972/g.10038 Transcript_5972/m.10038 type:complete len:223 (-) Transcript_5972:328-996(-)